jgi:hypothetical protein
MTLVITEVSERFGCVMVGDTAVTIDRTDVRLGAEKIHYASRPNIGFALWGNACLMGRRVDELLRAFVESLPETASPRSAGRDLADLLAQEGTQDGRSWEVLRGGVHLCGYQDDIPVLFHVHTGADPPAPQGPHQLYEDVPDAGAGAQLRNGYYRMFVPLFDGMQQYVTGLNQLGFTWPLTSLDDRVSYYEILVQTVARTLLAAGRVPSVGQETAAIAFTRNGLQVDKRQSPGPDFCRRTVATAAFLEFHCQKDTT